MRVDQCVHRVLLLIRLLGRHAGGGVQCILHEVLQRQNVPLLLLLRHLTPELKLHHLLNDLANVVLKTRRRRLGSCRVS